MVFEVLEISFIWLWNLKTRQVKESKKQVKKNNEERWILFWFVIEIIEAISKNLIKNEIVQFKVENETEVNKWNNVWKLR